MMRIAEAEITGKTRRVRRSTAVSQALRAIQEAIEAPPDRWPIEDPRNSETRYSIRVAADRASREKAYRLAYEVYEQKGYASDHTAKWIVGHHDARLDTLTLLVEDNQGKAIATASLVSDGPEGLPSDAIFSEELNALRKTGRKIVEVTRLAIAEEHQHVRSILLRLINFLFIYELEIQHATDVVIEVNPRHAGFYKRFVLFNEVGPARSCPRVKGAPAVLLHLTGEVSSNEISRWAGRAAEARHHGVRTLFPYFLPPGEMKRMVSFLSRQHSPMTEEEIDYFGLRSEIS